MSPTAATAAAAPPFVPPLRCCGANDLAGFVYVDVAIDLAIFFACAALT